MVLSETTAIVYVDRGRAVKDPEYARSFSKTRSFCVYDQRFLTEVLGEAPSLQLIERRPNGDQFAHEAGVYIRSTNSVYFTSNFQTSDPVELYALDTGSHKITKLDYPEVVQANGACCYPAAAAAVGETGDITDQSKAPNTDTKPDRIIYCCQGARTTPSGLVAVDPATGNSETLINNFHGCEFSSPNDVVVHHPTGDIWFTDPTYGYEQGFRPAPALPPQVYRFRPSTAECWAVADGFGMCNGLCFSPDYSQLYVTDTGAMKAHDGPGDGHQMKFDATKPRSIYVYDVVGGTKLANRRMFAFCDTGLPDGIKCDENGYVYSGCGDGLHVWDPQGTLVGKIIASCTTANFCFTKSGIWMLNEQDLYFCRLKAKGALVAIECE